VISIKWSGLESMMTDHFTSKDFNQKMELQASKLKD
jgi:hypothetical protein